MKLHDAKAVGGDSVANVIEKLGAGKIRFSIMETIFSRKMLGTNHVLVPMRHGKKHFSLGL